ncbi:RHS domain-containing protein [Candidatus Desantisbacteria bacterium]|nr:RHS domain-containing protein [Candidatus Desantisbacteria bacterium]
MFIQQIKNGFYCILFLFILVGINYAEVVVKVENINPPANCGANLTEDINECAKCHDKNKNKERKTLAIQSLQVNDNECGGNPPYTGPVKSETTSNGKIKITYPDGTIGTNICFENLVSINGYAIAYYYYEDGNIIYDKWFTWDPSVSHKHYYQSAGVHNYKAFIYYCSNGTSNCFGWSAASITWTVNVVDSIPCKPDITSFTGNSIIIDPEAGGTITLTGAISDPSNSPISWTVDIAGKTYPGTGTQVSVLWDGKNADGTIVDPGSYTATLTAWHTDNPSCSDVDTENFMVIPAPDGSCGLFVDFGSSANITSGNLTHDQTLFSTKGAGLSTGITLYYNSFIPYTGHLGRGWVYSYDIALKENSDGSIVLREGNGNRKLYTKNSSGYISMPGDHSVLTKNTDSTFVIAYVDGIQQNFSSDGKIMSIADRNSNPITFSYTNGNLTTITDPSGRNSTINYDTNNHITSIIDPNGNSYLFTINSNVLTDITYPGGGHWHYMYDDKGFMLSKTDPNGNITTYIYDSTHRVIMSTDPDGKTRSIIYPVNTDTLKTTTFMEKDGGGWQYSYNTQDGTLIGKIDPDGNSMSYTYDQNRNMLTKTDTDGKITNYAYDTDGNMTSVTNPLGETTTYTYNTFDQVTSITDCNGNISAYSYDGRGNLTSTTDPTGVTIKYEYDVKGNIIKVINSPGQVTVYAYDDSNNLISVTDPTGAVTKSAYDKNGNITSQTDANLFTTTFEYNSLNQLIKITDPNGNAAMYTYDKNGNRISETNAGGNTTLYEYNFNNQLIRVKDAMGNITSYTYGSAGCSSCGGGVDKLTSITDANGNITRYVYDNLGRRVKEIDAMDNVTLYTYDAKGNVITKTDPSGHVTSYTYDALSRLKEETNPFQGIVKFEYSTKGQITKATDALGNITTYEYDAAGRVIKTTSSDTGTITYTYNNIGALDTKTDANGTAIKYIYDNLNRLTKTQFSDSSQNIIYTYDESTSSKGRLSTMTDSSGTTIYEYDNLGRVIKEIKNILGITYTTEYSYDKVNNLIMVTYPGGRKVTYSFDKLNRPVGITSDFKNIVTLASNFIYDPVSNTRSITIGNGLTRSWTYDPDNRIKTIDDPNVLSLSYSYDPVGNITSVIEELDPARSKTYTYDPLNRLASSTGLWGDLKWTYDANSNRLTQTNGKNSKYTYEANRLMTVSNGHINYYKYDNNGNTTSDGIRDFVYNQNSRLIKAMKKSRIIGEYTYNGNGQRVIKKTKKHKEDKYEKDDEDEHAVIFHYDQAGRLIEETTAKGKLIVDYIYLNATPLAMIRKQEHKEEIFYYHNDHLGTPKVMTDKNKKVVWNVEFDPFGNEIDDDNNNDNNNKHKDKYEDGEHNHKERHGKYIRNVTNNLRFPGQYYDEETGLNYNYFRDYNPVIGRYIEADPFGIKHGNNHLFTYSSNNAVNRIDPFGLQDANTWTYGEIRPWAITSIRPRNFTPPAGLSDCKASIGAACNRGNPCSSVDGSTATAPEDQAAWGNIVNATGGTDRSGYGNFMCVGSQNCWFVHSCNRCCGGNKVLVERSTNLALTGTATVVNKGTLYFYRDDNMGWCSRADYNRGCP